ncbi:MAG: ankyrin repeat domain-containing protein, partial [Phycisphaerales bacterium JB038]
MTRVLQAAVLGVLCLCAAEVVVADDEDGMAQQVEGGATAVDEPAAAEATAADSATEGEPEDDWQRVHRLELPPPDLTGAAPIHVAAMAGDIEGIRRELEAGADVNLPLAPPGEKWLNATPLMVAAINGQLEAARALIEAGADLELQTDRGATALAAAALYSQGEMVQLLLDAGAEVNPTDAPDRTPLMAAATSGTTEIVQLLLDAGADVEARGAEGGREVIHGAAARSEERR